MFKIITAVATCILALIGTGDQARAQVGVAVSVTNNTAATVRGVFQSTDVGDMGTGCTASSGTGPSNCNYSVHYNHPPKNMKNMLCVNAQVSFYPTAQCLALTQVNGCTKKNKINKSYCGNGYKGALIPNCDYRTGSSGFSSWTWTVSLIPNTTNQMNVDCSISGYTVWN
jgi:hypothetical protein